MHKRILSRFTGALRTIKKFILRDETVIIIALLSFIAETISYDYLGQIRALLLLTAITLLSIRDHAIEAKEYKKAELIQSLTENIEASRRRDNI